MGLETRPRAQNRKCSCRSGPRDDEQGWSMTGPAVVEGKAAGSRAELERNLEASPPSWRMEEV